MGNQLSTSIDDPSSLSIRHRLRFLLKDSALYGGAAALNKAFSLITFPLLARHFSVADYGIIDFLSILVGLLVTFFIFGQDSAVARFFYEYKDEQQRKQLISQSLVLQIAFLLVVLPILWVVVGSYARTLHDNQETELLLKLLLLQVPFFVLINFSQNLLMWTFLRVRFLIVSFGSVVLKVSLLIVMIIAFDIGVIGVFKISFAVSALFGLLGLFFTRHWLTWPAGFQYLRQLVPFAIPYGVICCIGAFIPTMERSLTNSLLGSHELGLYAAGAKVAMLLTLVIQAFQTAWGPFSLAVHKEPDAALTYNWVFKCFAVVICVATLLLSSVGGLLIHILASDRYMGASIVVFPLAMGLAIQGTSWITEIGISLSKKSYLNLYSYTAFLIGSGVAIFTLTKGFGLPGVALGVLVGHVAKAVLASWLAQRTYPLPWVFRPVLILMAGNLGIGLLGVWSDATSASGAATALYGSGAIGMVILGWLLVFSHDDRRHILSELRAVSSLLMQAIRGRYKTTMTE